jgi:hypothetical protein
MPQPSLRTYVYTNTYLTWHPAHRRQTLSPGLGRHYNTVDWPNGLFLNSTYGDALNISQAQAHQPIARRTILALKIGCADLPTHHNSIKLLSNHPRGALPLPTIS